MVYYKDSRVTIRDMEEADAQVFTDEEIAQGWHADIAKYLMRLKDSAEGRCVSLTAEYDGRPAGYVNVYRECPVGPFAGQGLPEIVDFGVLEKYRRKGIGTRLMDAAEKIAGETADTVFLCVGLHNGYGSAQRMYVRRGYIPDGSGVWYRDRPCTPYDTIYTNDDDMVLYMSKKLPPRDRSAEAAARFAECTREILGENLAGIYLHGSAAMGCFRQDRSDLDVLVVVRENIPDAVKRAYLDRVAALSAQGPAGGIEMSAVTLDACDPFVYPTPFILHYSEGHAARYRRDPEDYIRSMNGTDRDLAAHFTVIRARGRCLYGLPIHDVFGPVPLRDYADALWCDVSNAAEEIADNPVYYTLNLARTLAFLRDRTVLSKREGGEWGLRNLPEEYLPTVRAALRDYTEGTDTPFPADAAARYAAYMLKEISGLTASLRDEGAVRAGIGDVKDAATLACELWPDHTPDEMTAEYLKLHGEKDAALFLYRRRGEALGFAECRLRHDYVEGAETSPVGYLEGIFVRETERRRGIARALLNACRDWAKQRGCAEFASDCELENTESQAFHRAVGFREANRIAAYIQKI